MQETGRQPAVTDLSPATRCAAGRAALVASEPRAAHDLLHVISLSPMVRLRRLLEGDPCTTRYVLQEPQGDVLVSVATALQPDAPG